jgi:hypothetical protein
LKLLPKYILLLALLNAVILLSAYLLGPVTKLSLSLHEILILSSAFSVISFFTVFIFLKGQSKEPDSQTLYSLVALVVKFLLELVFALLWFFLAKKTSLQSVLMFFVLYLALTLFSISVIVKTLKNKALKNQNCVEK